MKLSDLLSGLLCAVAGLLLAAAAQRLPDTPGQVYGAGFFPTLLGVAIAAAGAALALRALRERRARPLLTPAGWWRRPADWSRFLLPIAAVLFYIAASDALGFALCAMLIVGAMALWFGAGVRLAAVAALLIPYLFELVFGWLLRVPLPRGPLDFLL